MVDWGTLKNIYGQFFVSTGNSPSPSLSIWNLELVSLTKEMPTIEAAVETLRESFVWLNSKHYFFGTTNSGPILQTLSNVIELYMLACSSYILPYVTHVAWINYIPRSHPFSCSVFLKIYMLKKREEIEPTRSMKLHHSDAPFWRFCRYSLDLISACCLIK